MSSCTVLMVAEKPSIALALSGALCDDGDSRVQKRRGVSPSSPVYEYAGDFHGVPARFKVTATTGHVYSLDFSKECNDWNKVSPAELFHAPTIHCYDPRANIPAHLAAEAKGCDVLVLWLDCDREGENICFEVMKETLPSMRRGHDWPGSYEGCVYRAQFSSLSAVDLRHAMQNLGHPNIRQAHSVDARQEIDLRLGVAFSRLQTSYFRKHFGNQLGRKMVTYGPCQFPTLWFCVKRHSEIEAFVPLPFWRLKISADFGGVTVDCLRDGGDMWNEAEVQEMAAEMRASGGTATIKSTRTWRSSLKRPLPLNTVAMLRMASDELGIGPGDAMHMAEQLYLKGVMSYPRTETAKYPANFDLEGTARLIATPSAPWAACAQRLLADGLTPPRQDGYDAGDHPPITPVKMATVSQCGGDAGWELYKAICTHFLASVSPDCLYDEAEAKLELASELFVARSSRCVQEGWMEVDGRDAADDGPVDMLAYRGREGLAVDITDVKVTSHQTRPPGHLSESELLGLMDKHGIGTDASMATHVSNVQNRAYVDLDPNTRQMIPSALGLALANAYALIDPGLILPSVRSRIENECSSIAKGLATKEAVIARTIRIFERKMHNFSMKIDRLPLMLAVAYAQERGGGQVAGDAAGEGLILWQQAKKVHASITLEQLIDEKERVELDEEDGSIPPPQEVMQRVEEQTPAVLRVQQALEELGFGSPDAAPQPKAKGKAKPAPASPPALAPPPTSSSSAPPAQGSGGADLVATITAALRQRGGSMLLGELSAVCPGLKKPELEQLRAFDLVPGDKGICTVCIRDLGGGVSANAASGAAAGSTAGCGRGKGGRGGKGGTGGKGAEGDKYGARGKDGGLAARQAAQQVQGYAPQQWAEQYAPQQWGWQAVGPWQQAQWPQQQGQEWRHQ